MKTPNRWTSFFTLLAGAAAVAFAVTAAMPDAAAAQWRENGQDIILLADGSPGIQGDYNVTEARRQGGFNLFSGGDAAIIGFRRSGAFRQGIDNYGICADILRFCGWHTQSASQGFNFKFFEILWAAATPPSEWAKIRQIAPEAANALGGGYAFHANIDGLFTSLHEWGPRDGTLGRLFSGVTSTSGGECTDVTVDGWGSGFQMLATSDCPDTWPSGEFRGSSPISGDTWLELFNEQGNDFAFDFWGVPEDRTEQGKFLGNRMHAYGAANDYYQEIREAYGSAVPGGTGTPVIDGYPNGLEWVFEAFNFTSPALANVNFYRALVINKSAEVWGEPGVDYDSLYLGLTVGDGATQQNSRYYMPELGVALWHTSNVQGPTGPCGEAFRAPAGTPPISGAFPGCRTDANRGYGVGGDAIIWLKSPIGDLRNKKFSDPNSPFFNPSHPLAGDTITFQHGRFCIFGSSCWNTTIGLNDRRAFGMIASVEEAVLDGRAVGDLTPGQNFYTFRSAEFGGVNQPPGPGAKFNRYVPGNWKSSALNTETTADTLRLDTCHEFGCIALDGDTMPGGQINSGGNIGGVIGVGPVKLAAGDTTSFFFAFVGEADSASTWASINAALDAYQNFFLGPEPAAKAEVVSTRVEAATSTRGNEDPGVTLFFSDDPETWTDPFLSKLADDLEAAPAGTPAAGLRDANPGLVDSIRTIAGNNLEAIEVYRSCDGGASFDSDGDCLPDPTNDEAGAPVGLGWRPYATLQADAQGDFPNAFSDGDVTAGRTYLYVIVGRTRGATFVLNVPGSTVPELTTFAPSLRNPLATSTSEPNVASVYIPASNNAGFRAAEVTLDISGSPATAPLEADVETAAPGGSYRAVFGNRTTIVETANSGGDLLQTEVLVEYVVTADDAGTPVEAVLPGSVSLTRANGERLPIAGNRGTSTVVDTVTTTVIDRLGFVLAADNTPLFHSNNLTGDAATPTGVFLLSDFPGFSLSVENDQAGEFATEEHLRSPEDTIERGTVDGFMVQWRESTSDLNEFDLTNAPQGGVYRVSWSGDPFGVARGIVLNFENPAATEAEFVANLRARPGTTIGATDSATAALVGVPIEDLVPVRLPFSVRNETFDRDVTIAMRSRLGNSFLLGFGVDTITVEIPADEWVPGDELVFIENITKDSIVGYTPPEPIRVLDGSGTPIRVTRPEVTFDPAVFGCNSPREACNPTLPGTPGENGYFAIEAGQETVFEYYVGFDPSTRVSLNVTPPITGAAITAVTEDDLSEIRVVPNPFVVFSEYQTNVTDSRVLFTNLPPTGTLRIYTVSGQFVQEIRWTAADLEGQGDLFYDLRTREGIEMATGLYIWAVNAPSNPDNPNSTPVVARGKFVVIRGSAR